MPLGGITLNLLSGDLLTSYFQEMIAENMQAGMYPTVLTEIEATELPTFGQSLEFYFEDILRASTARVAHAMTGSSPQVSHRAALHLCGLLPPDRHVGEPDLLAVDYGHLRYGLHCLGPHERRARFGASCSYGKLRLYKALRSRVRTFSATRA